MGKIVNAICLFLYAVSAVAALFITGKVIEVRSKCTAQKKKITAIMKEINELKDENNRLMIEYYTKVRPELSDKGSSDLKTLHENEVEFVQ